MQQIIINPNEFKLTKAVLFKTGIATFEKECVIEPAENSTISIRFNTQMMNDILKTFSLYRTQGNVQIRGISYEPATNTGDPAITSKIAIDPQNAYQSLITQLRGVHVKITTVSTAYEGKIIGLETRTEKPATPDSFVKPKVFLILGVQTAFIQILTDDITGFQIIDQKTAKNLNFFLELIKTLKIKEIRNFNLIYSATQQSKLIIRYLQEFPGWKLSYRLNLKSAETGDPSQTLLQAWAIVDNTLDENWDGINLTLVSGMPVSFIYDTYSPKWIKRPKIERKKEIEINVATLQSGKKDLAMGGAPVMPGAPAPAPPPSMAMMKQMAPMKMKKLAKMDMAELSDDDTVDYMMAEPRQSLFEPEITVMPEEEEPMEEAFESATEEDKGEGKGFRYKIGTPISLKRNNSGLIPILQSETKANLYALYNPEIQKEHPMNIVEFKNTADVSLEEGPISIYKESIFLGESILPFTSAAETKKIPYSIDVSVRVNLKIDYQYSDIHEIIYRNEFTKAKYQTMITTYNIENDSDDEKVLFIEHKIQPEYELHETDQPEETTKNYYRYKFKINAKTKYEFKIKERKTYYEYIQLEQLNAPLLQDWLSMKLISAEKYQALAKYLDLANQKSVLQTEFNFLEQKIREIIEDQYRIKENLKSLRESAEEKSLRISYIKTLVEDEENIDKAQKTRKEILANLEGLERKLQEAKVQIYKSFK